MPKTQTETPELSLPERIKVWLAANPGAYRPVHIAEGMRDQWPETTKREVTNELPRMAAKGVLVKTRPGGVAANGPYAFYELAKD